MSNSAHVILQALETEASRLYRLGKIGREEFDNEPESHVFYPDPGEPWDDDDVAAIKAVGDQDIAAKIAYWSKVLDSVDTD